MEMDRVSMSLSPSASIATTATTTATTLSQQPQKKPDSIIPNKPTLASEEMTAIIMESLEEEVRTIHQLVNELINNLTILLMMITSSLERLCRMKMDRVGRSLVQRELKFTSWWEHGKWTVQMIVSKSQWKKPFGR